MPNPKYLSDEWYISKGVEPPEHISHGQEEDIKAKMANIKHGKWTQQGNVVTCGVCPYRHSSIVPVNVLLTGTDDNGLPMFKELS